MRVCYLGRRSSRKALAPLDEGDVIELLWDNWDDYGYKTSFQITCRIGGDLVELGSIRLLLEKRGHPYQLLDQILEDGWSGTFPIPGTNYISVPTELTFYQQLKAHLGGEGARQVAEALKDASYLVRLPDNDALRFLEGEGFKKSLLRERGSIAAFLDGWKIFEEQAIAVNNFRFKFIDVFQNISELSLNFSSDTLLPHDINILIGPNGSGKSQVLRQIVEAWLSPDERLVGFERQPNLSQIVVISYSPFEKFPVDMEGVNVQDKDVYKYFGFRGRSGDSPERRSRKIKLSHGFPRQNSARSLISCIEDDQKYRLIDDWGRKIFTMEDVLREAFQFDFVALEVGSAKDIRSLYLHEDDFDELSCFEENGSVYIPIEAETVGVLNASELRRCCLAASGVNFYKDNNRVELSSGQRLFAYVVINILGAIRRNSLILIDEPELFLHPTLEIQFVEMLKEILNNFNSKALMATHSEVVVREVPADCVHVFRRAQDSLTVTRPPFQTFGGDIQRISSYVFGDNGIRKPYEKWIIQKLEQVGNAEALIQELGNDLNEELLVQIKALGGRRTWL